MSSLVAYEDSESEDEALDQTEGGASASVQAGSYGQNQEVVMCNSSKETPSPQSFTPNPEQAVFEYHGSISDRRVYSLQAHLQPPNCFDRSRTAQHKNFKDAPFPPSLPATQGKILPLHSVSHMSQSFGDRTNPAKRQSTVPSGVRPYIPKRQKLATSVKAVDQKYPAEQAMGNQTRESQILSDVSAIVKPYLAHKPVTAGIPRKLLMSLGGHQGPVNTVQWCPVPHLSHLLLSASMDKTFKVWDGAESGRCLRVYTCHSGAVRDACWTPCGRHLLTGSFDNMAVITDVETVQCFSPVAQYIEPGHLCCASLFSSNIKKVMVKTSYCLCCGKTKLLGNFTSYF